MSHASSYDWCQLFLQTLLLGKIFCEKRSSMVKFHALFCLLFPWYADLISTFKRTLTPTTYFYCWEEASYVFLMNYNKEHILFNNSHHLLFLSTRPKMSIEFCQISLPSYYNGRQFFDPYRKKWWKEMNLLVLNLTLQFFPFFHLLYYILFFFAHTPIRLVSYFFFFNFI